MKAAQCVVVGIAMGIAGCVSEAAQKQRKEAEIIGRAQARVAALLRDPASAEFSDVEVRGQNICGVVRGRNGFGGYGSSQKFVVVAGVATIDPSASPTRSSMAQVRASEQCLFDVEYRTCRGEEGLSTPMERCLTGERMVPPGQAITSEVAEEACRKALEKRFREDVRPGQLIATSAKSKKFSAAWHVTVNWSASDKTLIGSSTGTCIVRGDGRTLVRSLFAE